MNKIQIVIAMVFICMSVNFNGFGQTVHEENAVKEVIVSLFKGMELADTAMMRKTFVSGTALMSVSRDKNNDPVLTPESVNNFLKAIARPHPEPYFEEIWNVKVLVDGDLAQVWCDYGFYVGKKFSHCGVDAFHLHKGKEGWKIFHLADTRRKTRCEIPKEIQEKHR